MQRKMRTLLPKQRIVVGLLGVTENVTDATRRVRDSGADEVVTTLADAVLQLVHRGVSLSLLFCGLSEAASSNKTRA
jgi:hypothetical protein